jgi:hypothetical protein
VDQFHLLKLFNMVNDGYRFNSLARSIVVLVSFSEELAPTLV